MKPELMGDPFQKSYPYCPIIFCGEYLFVKKNNVKLIIVSANYKAKSGRLAGDVIWADITLTLLLLYKIHKQSGTF